ncbi:hypothetical protein ER57_11910 [Smithella sp. SCADC]|jgi:hypothetical protein|nr:hypothetical protein ER57_11910 [Smithella sp. SCADC]
MIEEKIDRNVFEVINLHEADDKFDWLNRSTVERLEAIEFMRKVMFGHDRVSARLQRVLEIVDLKSLR